MAEEDSRKSQYQRKLARQRQLELMEAAAMGTVPSMQLDLGSGGIRSRSGKNGDDLSFVGDEHQPAVYSPSNKRTSLRFSPNNSPTGTGKATSNPFKSRSAEDAFSINLMDHDAGVYREDKPRGSIFNTMKSIFQFPSTQRKEPRISETINLHDMEETDAEIDYLGTKPDWLKARPGESRRASPMATLSGGCGRLCAGFLYQLQQTWTQPRRRRLLFMALFCTAIVVLTVVLMHTDNPASKYYHHFVTEPYLRAQNTARFNEIMDTIVMASVSHTSVFQDLLSPEYHALRWIAYSDEAKLDPADPMLLQRYALAVIFYNSFITFETIAGRQQPVIIGDKQWEGVPNPGWVRKDYWMTEKGHCMWFGISCTPNDEGENHYDENAPVVSLNLTKNHVLGPLPPELKALESLESLDLSHNKVEGSIPWQVGKMFHIKTLYLHQNTISGSLPGEIGFWEGMQDLRLGNNLLKGSIPSELNRLYNLEKLALDHNQFTGQIPIVKSLTKLEQLYLDNNKFSGNFPFTLIFLKNLLELNMNDNHLTGTLPAELENLRHLRNLHLQNNKLHGKIPDAIFTRMLHLAEITLENNALTGDLPEDMGSERLLRVVRFNNNQLSGSIPTTWDQMIAVEILHLHENKLKGTLPPAIGNMTALQELYLNNNQLTGMIPEEIGQATSLKSLFMEHNEIGGRVPTSMGKLENLRTLRMFDNKIRGFVPDEVCDLSSFHKLTTFSADCAPFVGIIMKCDCCTKCY
jgi:hypothetical protein